MKVLLSWMREFAPFDAPPDRIAHDLSMLGMTVEEMTVIGGGLDDIRVARVLQLRPHPDADNVQLVQVDAGAGDAVHVVCGAFNMKVGDLVPLAPVGAVLPNGLEIGRRKIRGEYSNGMLCSSIELELGTDAGGIMILPDSATVGDPLVDALGLEIDVLYDLEVNPNRPDAMSVAGVARDLAARHRVPFAIPQPSVTRSGDPSATATTVEIVDTDLCGRFTATVLRNVRVEPSPAAIARRLDLLGMRPINNVVDVSNYVMLELGQPNHPYDLRTLPDGAFRIRRARDGETLRTLDGVDRTFTSDDLLICDGEDRSIGIAGIMGGEATEISETTTDVVLEMAWFQPMAIAKTGRRLALRSEASARFEKGADPDVIELAVARFGELLGANAALAPDTVDARGELPQRAPVRLRTSRVNAILGTDLGTDDVRSLLEPIGFTSTPTGDDHDVVIPSWRLDCEVEIDLIEEVARHHGYEMLGSEQLSSARFGTLTPRQLERRAVRRALVGLGIDEAMPMPFLAPGDLARAGLDVEPITITNPLVAEESVLRPSLLPGLVKAVAYNLSHRQSGVALFEIGHVFLRPDDPKAELPDEREHLGAALVGREAPAAVEAWTAVADCLGIAHQLRAAAPAGLHPGRAAEIVVNGETVGVLGEVDPGGCEAFGVNERVAWLEVDLGRLLDRPHGERPFRAFSKFPSSDIDLAFEVDSETAAGAVVETVRSAGGDLVVGADLFDVYRGEGVADGSRSLAIRVRFQAPDRTLTDAEVGEVRRTIIDAVERAHSAKLRG